MGLYKNFVSQTRKPEGALGKVMLNGMNSGHAKMADWGFSHLPDITPTEVTDLGCGGGRNAGELLRKYPKANVTAIDYSTLSVEKARDYNKNEIASGRCTVMQGNVSDLKQYIHSIEHGIMPSQREILSMTDRYNDMITTRLRTSRGISLDAVRTSYGEDMVAYLLENAAAHLANNWLKVENGHLRLTLSGIMMSDTVMSDLIKTD
jgi:SAM-dependent methyltransferase